MVKVLFIDRDERWEKINIDLPSVNMEPYKQITEYDPKCRDKANDLAKAIFVSTEAKWKKEYEKYLHCVDDFDIVILHTSNWWAEKFFKLRCTKKPTVLFSGGGILSDNFKGDEEAMTRFKEAEGQGMCRFITEDDLENTLGVILSEWSKRKESGSLGDYTLAKLGKFLAPENLLCGAGLAALNILVQGYLAAIYLGKDALTIKEVEQVFEALKTNKDMRSREELSKETSEGELAPSRLIRPLYMRDDVICDNSQGKALPNPFQDLAEGYYWFDSALYEVYSDCPETLSGDPSFFTSATDAEVQDLANFLGPGAEADLLKAILRLNESLIAAGKLCQNLCSGDQQVYSGSIMGGAIRTIWELIRSGLNIEVAKYYRSVSGDATEIVKSLETLSCEKRSGAVNRDDVVVEALFSLAFLEFRRTHELVTKAAARKKKLKNFREQRTRLNHSYLKNDFLSIFGPFRGPPYDVDSISHELLGPDRALDKHNDAIKSWNERIKPELLEFFNRDSFGPNIKPLESFEALAENCREWIKALDRFVADVWPGFFQLEIDAKKKEAKSFFAAGINLYQALRSLRVELDFFKYFSVRD